MMKRVAGLSLLVLGIGLAAPVQAQQDAQAALDALLADYATDDAAVVVQVTTLDGSWVSTAGLADGERPTMPDDRFRIASMSKTFVAAAALMLADEGVIGLDDAAADYLPGEIVERIANADVVTVRQLLGMRSGIDDYLAQPAFFDRVLAEPDHVWTAEEALTYAYDLPALFAPDEEFNYSNSNYLLAQLVLEDAAGLPLHTLMRERILDPLGMDDTYTQISETLDGGFVDSLFDFDGDGILDNLSLINDGAGLGDGALVSTAADLTTFYKALLQDQTLLPEAAMETLLDFADTGEGDSYSLGLTRLETPWGDAWGHSGGVVGFASVGAYLPELDTTVIVLSTSPNFDPTDLALDAVELLAG